MANPTELDETGLALWRAAEDGWADQPRHDRFVQHAFASGGAVAAVARYSARAAQHPDDPLAPKMIARLSFLVTQQALRPSPPAGRGLSRSPFFLGVVLVAAIAGAILGLLWRGAR
ncbi:MAG TPA: hypothetical protein VGP07_07945 [Polyangia bacterium]